MPFLFYGLALSLISGFFGRAIVALLTIRRRSPPLPRGWPERLISMAAGAVVGPLWIISVYRNTKGEVSGEIIEELTVMLGPGLIMPAAGAVAWLAGELASGPTVRSWRPYIATALASQLGYIAGYAALNLAGLLLGRLADRGGDSGTARWALYTMMAVPYIVGGLTSGWAYGRFRRSVVPRIDPTDREAVAS